VKRLFLLFGEMFRISLCTVGGGYAIVAVADDVFSRRAWTREGELLERLSLFQTIPGILAGHCAAYVGLRVAGVRGALAALAGVLLPSLAIFLLVSAGYATIPLTSPLLLSLFTGLRAGLAGVVGAMAIRAWRTGVAGRYGHAAVVAGCCALAAGLNPALILLLAMGAGLARTFCARRGNCCSLPLIALLFLKYGALAFGGGYVLVPFYLADFIGPHAPFLQLPEADFANLMALTQMTPGPIGINAATFFGYRLGGVGGACAATVALVAPGFLVLLVAFRSLARFAETAFVRGLLAGVRPVTVSLMLGAFWAFARLAIWPGGPAPFNGWALGIALVAGALVALRRMGVMGVIGLSAVLGFLCA
jgi:chromate transporter